jgi:hypothetical protein
VIDCISVVMDEETEHYRYAVRDLAALEQDSRGAVDNARDPAGWKQLRRVVQGQ